MKNFVIYLTIFVIFAGTTYQNKSINLIYDEWILVDSYVTYIKVIKKYGMVDGTYDSIKIYPSDRLKKISDEIAVLHDIAWEVSIIDIVGEYLDYKMKFKYSVDVVINDKGEFTAKWYKGEMYMHFNNNDEVWFELIKMESNNSNKGTYPRKFIKYGKSNIYKRAKVLKSSFPID